MLMKKSLTIVFAVLTIIAAKAQNPKGVELAVADMRIHVTFYSPDIVRVTKVPVGSKTVELKSEVVTMSPQTSIPVTVTTSAAATRLKSSSLIVTVDRRTGLLSFASSNGKSLLKEKATRFETRPQGSDKGRYTVTMTYQLDKDEAIYGLGTVQDGKLNRRGLSKRIEQSNLEDYQNIIRAAFQNDKEKAFQADRKYTDMLDYYTMWAHQIKTPIAAMKLLIQSGEMDEETRGSLLDQLFRTEQYVEMVLCYVRLSGQVSDYVIAEYDLDDIVRQAVRKFAPVFIRSRCRLVYEPLNCSVLTDEKWLVAVIEQILSNSLKYTEAAGKDDPYVEICMDDANDADGKESGCVLVIRDNGIGIAAEDLPRIFEKGYTGCNGRTDKKSTGLGLYLCSRICRNLGHGIGAVSEAGEGTEIRLDLSRKALKTE